MTIQLCFLLRNTHTNNINTPLNVPKISSTPHNIKSSHFLTNSKIFPYRWVPMKSNRRWTRRNQPCQEEAVPRQRVVGWFKLC